MPTYEFGDCDICGTQGVLIIKHPSIWMCMKHWVNDYSSKKGA